MHPGSSVLRTGTLRASSGHGFSPIGVKTGVLGRRGPLGHNGRRGVPAMSLLTRASGSAVPSDVRVDDARPPVIRDEDCPRELMRYGAG